MLNLKFIENKQLALKDTLLKLLRHGYKKNLLKIIEKTKPVDLAHIFQNIDEKDRKKIFNLIEDEVYLAEVLVEITDKDIIAKLLIGLDYHKIYKIFENIDSDDAADLIGILPEDEKIAILSLMKKEDAQEIKKLLKYDPNTAGGLMNPDFFALPANITAEEGLKKLRETKDIDMVFYIYVVDDHNKLVGVLSLRQLVLAKPDTAIANIMENDVIFVKTDTDQELVSRIVARYDLLALPVVNEEKTLMGMITVDDVLDVIKDEATEDILMMSGTTSIIDFNNVSIYKYAKARFPWLLACFIGGIVSSKIVGNFSETLANLIILAYFMPLVLGMSGNIGSQSATIIIRNLALGKIDTKKFFKIIFKELRLGMAIGLIYAILLSSIAIILYSHTSGFYLVVGISIFIAMSTAASMGGIIPLLLQKFGIDPALASGPFVTTIMDLLGVTIYFTVATIILSYF